MNLRNVLEQMKAGQMDSNKLYAFLVENLSTLFVLYIRSGIDKNPLLTRGIQPSQFYVAAFTDQEAAEQVCLEAPYKVELKEEATLSFLMKTYRGHHQGVIFNPGLPSHFFVKKDELRELITEYAVEQLSNMPGAWIPTMGSNMLLVEYQKNAYTVAIYANKEDAEEMCRAAGGTAVMHQWNDVFERAKQVNAQSLFLHFHLPEQIYLSMQHIEKIWKGKHSGFQGHMATTHQYSVKTIEQAQAESETPEPKTVEPRLDSDEKQVIQPKEDEEAVIASPDQDEPSKRQDAPVKKQEVLVDNSRNSEQVEPTEQKEVKQLPSERVNPYSIKNKQRTEFDIYLGNTEVKRSGEDQPVVESSPVDHTKQKSTQLERPQVQEEKKQSVEQTKSEQIPLKATSQSKPAKHEQQPDQQKVESVPKGNQGLSPAIRNGLERLEQATVEGQGMANGWEVCQSLAGIRRIWIIVDQGDNMVILAGQDQSPIVDFFTSDVHAERLIKEAQQNNPDLPSMSPQLVSTRKLYRALSPRQPIVWINRGSSGAWTSVMGDTLPYVMQLMAQLEQEQI